MLAIGSPKVVGECVTRARYPGASSFTARFVRCVSFDSPASEMATESWSSLLGGRGLVDDCAARRLCDSGFLDRDATAAVGLAPIGISDTGSPSGCANTSRIPLSRQSKIVEVVCRPVVQPLRQCWTPFSTDRGSEEATSGRSVREFCRQAHLRKSTEELDALRLNPSSRFILLYKGSPVMSANDFGLPSGLGYFTLTEVEAAVGPQRDSCVEIFLGADAVGALFAVEVNQNPCKGEGSLVKQSFTLTRPILLTDAPMQFSPPITEAELELIQTASAICHWHRSESFCPKCGAPSAVHGGGHTRRCTNDACAQVLFPRTDPAVLMLVTNETNDRVLLARASGWPDGSFSTLAGFVEPGESAEGAVIRETFEEVGVRCHSPRSFTTLPWPFPRSLMLSYFAVANDADPLVLEEGEIEEARWFDREEVKAARVMKWRDLGRPSSGTLTLPPSGTVSLDIILSWLRDTAGSESEAK